MSSVASYMKGSVPDVFGRFISEIHNYNHFWLEHDHKFIQVLFPIDYGHKFNKHALIVEQDDIDAFNASA